jgi:hypothetical protein
LRAFFTRLLIATRTNHSSALVRPDGSDLKQRKLDRFAPPLPNVLRLALRILKTRFKRAQLRINPAPAPGSGIVIPPNEVVL